MPHAPGHGGDFDRQYSQQIADTASKIRGLENTKTFQEIVSDSCLLYTSPSPRDRG